MSPEASDAQLLTRIAPQRSSVVLGARARARWSCSARCSDASSSASGRRELLQGPARPAGRDGLPSRKCSSCPDASSCRSSTTVPTRSPSRRSSSTMRSGRSRRIPVPTLSHLRPRRASAFRIRGCTARRIMVRAADVHRASPSSARSPSPSRRRAPTARFLGVFALIGLYVGVIPVALGLLWYPLMQPHRPSRPAVPAGAHRRAARPTCSSMRRTMGSSRRHRSPARCRARRCSCSAPWRAYLGLDLVGAWLALRRRARESGSPRRHRAGSLRVLIAVGIGLHNFGEGLAIGSAFALGELALGTLLIVGFTLHNTTEGLAIVAPLARQDGRTARRHRRLLQLGLIGGVPTILGAWLGASSIRRCSRCSSSRLASAAIAQVTRQIVMQSAGERGLAAYLREAHVVAGLAVGVLMMYVTGLIVG